MQLVCSRAPLKNGVSSQRGIKHSTARRDLQLMALVLSKKHNDADECFRPRPKGLPGEPAPLFRGALVLKKTSDLIDSTPVQSYLTV